MGIVGSNAAAVCSDIWDARPLEKFPPTLLLLIPKQVFLALCHRVEAMDHLPLVERRVKRVRLEVMAAPRTDSMRRHHQIPSHQGERSGVARLHATILASPAPPASLLKATKLLAPIGFLSPFCMAPSRRPAAGGGPKNPSVFYSRQATHASILAELWLPLEIIDAKAPLSSTGASVKSPNSHPGFKSGAKCFCGAQVARLQ